jgi:hypothetical protein
MWINLKDIMWSKFEFFSCNARQTFYRTVSQIYFESTGVSSSVQVR